LFKLQLKMSGVFFYETQCSYTFHAWSKMPGERHTRCLHWTNCNNRYVEGQ